MSPFRRLIKQAKIVNRQMIGMGRREPYRPTMGDRQTVVQNSRLTELEQRCAEGEMFVPDRALPPWRRNVTTNLLQGQEQLRIKGLRLRAVDRQDEPGFPTHFR
eukprot:gene8208-5733_t